MRKISEVTRRDIFDIIQKGFDVLEYFNYETVDYGYIPQAEKVHKYIHFSGRFTPIEFLDRLYHLEEMPSKDRRHSNAKGDIYCHTVSFNDWPEFWFLDDERFKLKDGCDDEPILNFICEMLHPAVREESSPWEEYLTKFNELLKLDSYEIYASYRISGRDIYKFREYVEQEIRFDKSRLFTIRYKDLIETENGVLIDNICGKVKPVTKKKLAATMNEFTEPAIIKPNRYDSFEITTDALYLALKKLNEELGYPAIELCQENCFGTSYENQLSNLFCPYLFDLTELQFDEISMSEKPEFQQAINSVFKDESAGFSLTNNGIIVQNVEYEVMDNSIGENIGKINELGLRGLLDEAIALYRQPSITAHKNAVGKIWDALERLKSYYAKSQAEKRSSICKIVNSLSGDSDYFSKLFNDEFQILTDIGNDCLIRHSEVYKTPIVDLRYYDYLFNRCLSLIALSIQYLE